MESSEQMVVFYGYEYEAKLLTCLLLDSSFFSQISDILNPDYFSSEASQFVITKVLDYYKEHKTSPTYLSLSVYIIDIKESAPMLAASSAKFCADSYSFQEATDLDFIKTSSLNFCKNQAIRLAIQESVNLLRFSDFDGVRSTMDKALKVGASSDIGHIYKNQIEERYAKENRNPIQTPWKPINDLTKGGLSKGELGIIMAPGGAGKSWVLTALGAHAFTIGKTVLHYSLELNKIYVSLRYDTCIMKAGEDFIRANMGMLEDRLEHISGTLVVEEFPTKGASVLSLRAHIDRCISMGISPDLIIVDYADLLKGSNKDLRLELREIYESLRNLASEYQCPVWTASQTNRESLKHDVIGADKVSEDYSKIFIGDLIISLSRKEEHKILNQAIFHIVKNRFGKDGITFQARFDAAIGDIDIYYGDQDEAEILIKERNVSKLQKAAEEMKKYNNIIDNLEKERNEN